MKYNDFKSIIFKFDDILGDLWFNKMYKNGEIVDVDMEEGRIDLHELARKYPNCIFQHVMDENQYNEREKLKELTKDIDPYGEEEWT